MATLTPSVQPKVADHGPVDPFGGYFQDFPDWTPPDEGLLDIRNAHTWFDTVSWGSRTQLYTYQQPMEGKSGPFVSIDGRRMLMMASYDYLGLIGHPDIEDAAVQAVSHYGTGTGGVRLLTGTTQLHARFESELAAFLGTEAALTFSSGYLANVGVIAALMGPNDRVFMDALAHRSIADACRLARVPYRFFRHNDPDDLERIIKETPRASRSLILVEGLYSMDGDLCRLPEIVAIKEKYDAYLMIDEAHSIGALGRSGRGILDHFDLPASCVDLRTGSLSKAIPSNGGFVAGDKDMIIYLQHGAAPFMFSAALCPPSLAASGKALRVIDRETDRTRRLAQNTLQLREGLRGLGYDTGLSEGPIVPVVLGDDVTAYRMSRQLFDRGVLAPAIIFPAVPRGKARLRLCATASQSPESLDETLQAFSRIRHEI